LRGRTRTPSCFASFQATTRGTASQIIKSLERAGLVRGSRSDRDRRSVCFDLTEAGSAMLEQDPLRDLIGVIDALPAAERARFLATLSRLASALATRREGPAFGTCRDCRHLGTQRDTAYCACMAFHPGAEGIDRLCARYTPARDPQTQENSHDPD